MVLKIGHRGAMGYEPENTIASFKKALQLNVDAIELDVYVCKTGELVVFHDDNLKRTTNGRGRVVKKTIDELRNLDAGKGEKIPLLSEVLDLVDRKAKINIELKGKKTANPVAELIEKYVKEKNWRYGDFLVSSFNYYELKEFYKLNHHIKLGALYTRLPRQLKSAEKINAYSLHIPFEPVKKDFISEAHTRGYKVFVWKVNNTYDIEKIKKLNVDGIFSDYPDRI